MGQRIKRKKCSEDRIKRTNINYMSGTNRTVQSEGVMNDKSVEEIVEDLTDANEKASEK